MCWLRPLKRELEGWGRYSCCKGVGVGFVKAAVSHGGGRVRPGSRSDLEEAAGSRDYSRVVETLRVRLDSHYYRWSARRRGWNSTAGYWYCR